MFPASRLVPFTEEKHVWFGSAPRLSPPTVSPSRLTCSPEETERNRLPKRPGVSFDGLQLQQTKPERFNHMMFLNPFFKDFACASFSPRRARAQGARAFRV